MLDEDASLRDYELSSYYFSQWFDVMVVPKREILLEHKVNGSDTVVVGLRH